MEPNAGQDQHLSRSEPTGTAAFVPKPIHGTHWQLQISENTWRLLFVSKSSRKTTPPFRVDLLTRQKAKRRHPHQKKMNNFISIRKPNSFNSRKQAWWNYWWHSPLWQINHFLVSYELKILNHRNWTSILRGSGGVSSTWHYPPEEKRSESKCFESLRWGEDKIGEAIRRSTIISMNLLLLGKIFKLHHWCLDLEVDESLYGDYFSLLQFRLRNYF